MRKVRNSAQTADVQSPSRSHIPVMAPRPAESTLPSSLSTPRLGLGPPPRYLPVSGSPTYPSPGASAAGSNSSYTPFRSFRNLLSFGPGKQSPNVNSSASNLPRSPFGTLNSLRRSMNGERSVSAPHLRSEQSFDNSPVLSIELPRQGNDGSDSRKSGTGAEREVSHLTSPQTIVDKEHALPASELSTILESETSGISKYVPSLDDSECLEENGSQFLDLPLLRSDAETCRSGAHTPLSRDTSAFNLSMSKLSTEVLEAMSEGGTTGGWLSGVVVDELHDATESTLRQDTSFNLGALDPDLAALLSPHRLGSAEPALLVAIDVLPPPSTSSPVSPSTSPPHIALSTPSSSGNRSSASRSSSIHRTGSPNIAGPSNLSLSPRPSLVSDRPSLPRSARNPPSYALTRASSARPASRSPERASSGSGGQRSQSRLRRSPSSRSIEASGVPETRKPAISRLVTPGRPPPLMPQTKTSRPPLHHPNSTPTSLWEGSFVSPSSRAPSVAGTASSRLQDPRPSLDSSVDRQRPAWMRTRQRSVSVSEGRPSLQPASMRPAADLGPRTAKVFAAAGLLDSDKDPSITRPVSRFGSSRSSFERDSRSRCAPSRMALSDAGSSSSWARNGTMSHTIGISEGASMHGGESMSSPHTAFSSPSTAPTSVSAGSMHQHMQTELQLLQERHAVETGALLNALADSQRTTRVLREENAHLRDRLQDLEDRLADALDQIHRLQHARPTPPALKPSRNLHSKRASPVPADIRTSSTHSRLQSFLRHQSGLDTPIQLPSPARSNPSPETLPDGNNTLSTSTSNYRRISTSSSVFPPLPSDMSMIMHEENLAPPSSVGRSMRSVSPSSPTMVYSKLPVSGKQSPEFSLHAHKCSISSSAGNISPTTANFSMVTGSPGSLHLRPEHERHLGDMPMLDLHDTELYDDVE